MDRQSLTVVGALRAGSESLRHTMLSRATAAAALGLLAAACLLGVIAGPGAPAVLEEGPVTAPAAAQLLLARRMVLSERPGGHIPQQILRNINGLWNKSISGRRTKNRKTGGFNAPKQVEEKHTQCVHEI